MIISNIKPGYVYHIKDSYFEAVNDDKLMRNHEGGAYRPTYFCLKDKKTGLLWIVPMSSRVDKYQAIVDRDIKRYGKCLKIFVGEYANKPNAFLFQNIFPIIPKYISHIHTIGQNPVPVNERLQALLDMNFREIKRLHKRGAKLIFPDIDRLEEIMLNELAANKEWTINTNNCF
ncbi:MAG: hypothetical protein FWE29_04445 [Defluviitaleaceae bacterium]|nr:hypothetical protein [Defluviitaleaceae bacterium]